MRISLKTIIFALFIFTMFLPIYWSNSFFQLLQNGMFLAAAIMLVYRRYRLNKITLAIVIHYGFLILLTAIYKHWPFDIHMLVSHAKIVVCILAIDYMMETKPKVCLNTIFYVLAFFWLADFMSILLYPEGLYFVDRHWNEWSSTQTAQWLWGNKNNRVMWQLILQIVAFTKYAPANNSKRIIPYIIASISVITSILMKSSTATIVNAFSFLGLLIANRQRKRTGQFRLNAKWIFGVAFIINIAVISGNLLTQETSFLGTLVSRVFGKDLSTIFARKSIWIKVLSQIRQHPFGLGLISSSQATVLLGGKAFTDAHNMLLDLAWEGGIVSLAALLCVLFYLGKNVNSLSNPRNKVMAFTFIVCFLLEGITEAVLGQAYGWYFLIILYRVTDFLSKPSAAEQSRLTQPE